MNNFVFKKLPQDFIVEEKLWELPKGNGPVFYVLFEKKNKTTFDIILDLMNRFNLKRSNIGIAGLKDKVGITRQRLTIYKRYLDEMGGKQIFLNAISRNATILRTGWSDKSLTMGSNRGNLFFIRLRNLKNEKRFIEIVEKLKITGVPNFFGDQRFGFGGKNRKIGKDTILEGYRGRDSKMETGFRIQAFSSYIFNEYVSYRLFKGTFDKILTGDISVQQDKIIVYDDKDNYKNSADQKNLFVRNGAIDKETIQYTNSTENFIPSGPVLGYNMLIGGNFNIKGSSIDFSYISESLKTEIEVLKKNGIKLEDIQNFKEFEVFGLRRAIKMYPQDIRYKFDRGDALIMFELPSGSYASTVIEYIDEMMNDK